MDKPITDCLNTCFDTPVIAMNRLFLGTISTLDIPDYHSRTEMAFKVFKHVFLQFTQKIINHDTPYKYMQSGLNCCNSYPALIKYLSGRRTAIFFKTLNTKGR